MPEDPYVRLARLCHDHPEVDVVIADDYWQGTLQHGTGTLTITRFSLAAFVDAIEGALERRCA